MVFGRYQKPRDDAKYQWTNHVVGKMQYYRLSESRVRRVIASPKRVEGGIVLGTIAVMQPSPNKKEEVWVMYQLLNRESRNLKHGSKVNDSSFKIQDARKRIITAWRYPGVSKPRDPVPVPDAILDELKNLL